MPVFSFTPDTVPVVVNGLVHCSFAGRPVSFSCPDPDETAERMGPDCMVDVIVEDLSASSLSGVLLSLQPGVRTWTVADLLGVDPDNFSPW